MKKEDFAISKYIAFKSYIPIVLIIFFGILLSVSAFSFISKLETKEIELDFLHAAENRSVAVRNSFQSRVLILKAIYSFYEGSVHVENSEFREFVKPFIAEFKDIRALEWIPRVLHDERVIYEENAKRNGFTDFMFTERSKQGSMVKAGERDEYFPVYFVEPLEGNELALGFDLASNPTRLEALNLSRNTGKIVSTARITLVQEKEDAFGLLMFVPVYKKQVSLVSDEDRKNNLLGFGLGVFRIKDIVESAFLEFNPEGVDFFVHDKSASTDKKFLYYHVSRTRENRNIDIISAQQEFSNISAAEGLKYEMSFNIGERKMSILCVPSPSFISSRRAWYPIGLLMAGLIFTLLIGLYGYFIINRNVEIKILVDKKTIELKESEERWKFALEGSGDGVWDWDIQTDKVSFSKQWKKMLGFEDHEIKNDLSEWSKRVHPDDIDWVLEEVQKHFRKETPVYSTEHRVLCKDGKYKWILDRGKVLTWSEDGKPLRMIGTRADITIRKESEIKIKEAVAIKTEFTSMVSHELRTPLAVIMQGIKLVADGVCGELEKEQKYYLTMAERNVERLGRLINDVLDIQKLEAGMMEFNMQMNNINELVVQIQESMRPVAEKKGLNIDIIVDKSINEIKFDGDRIIQVLTNLVNNALKFTKDGKITIMTEKEDKNIKVSVSDTGSGIREEDMHKLFGKFEQIYTGRDRKTGGTGLGLAISKEIVERHNGKIWAESEFGKGTIFSFILPIVERMG